MPGATLVSKGRPYVMRDGATADDPVFIVDSKPTFFKTKSPREMRNDNCVDVVDDAKPLTDEEYAKQVKDHRARIDAEKEAKKNRRQRMMEAQGAKTPIEAKTIFKESQDDEDDDEPAAVSVSPFAKTTRNRGRPGR